MRTGQRPTTQILARQFIRSALNRRQIKPDDRLFYLPFQLAGTGKSKSARANPPERDWKVKAGQTNQST